MSKRTSKRTSKIVKPVGSDLDLCTQHREKYVKYCTQHDSPCCAKCTAEKHVSCKEIISLDEAVRHFKGSVAFKKIEKGMVDAAKNLKQIRKESEVNVSVITEERTRIESEIQQARNKINKYLDKIQNQMSKELHEVTHKVKKKSSDLNVVINEMERSIANQQSKIDKVKKDATDVQCFLSMKSTEAELNKIDKTINTIIDDGEFGILSISFNLDPAMENLALNANSFGHVIVEIKPFLSKSIEEISLNLQRTINTQVKQTEGCCLLDNGTLLFSDFLKDRVTVLSDNRELDIQIPIKSSLHGLTVIDSQTIAVSPGGSAPHVINVVDIKDKSIKKTIPVHSEVDGMVYREENLIYCARGDGIKMTNFTNGVTATILKCNLGQFANIANFKDKLFVTDRDEHTVTCCDLKGTVLWTFKDTEVLQRPWGITVDKDGNIYVVDWKDKLVVLSADGKRHKQLLSAKDGLKSPTTLFYHNHTNQLLVANEKNNALLYKLI
ncbi:uncharacterized protein LOC127723165 isoform X2 [Mytilus californianus]|uniref:uncharacterized protein LOC127723165 isoform X1 n=1 Tax=Mytilus californianus TaxID=6549 RepID=UPI0022462400|nr:uncharacterized protein LOC127723165 isoform X1 [Mytilus californianus]XP_052085634.1 uncharacterized protein LOC127723165 isoform X2 [Mytilus californianus]XP_052085635.1 uncharacterized protein LOC127723165 isoform X2 [Mytilus californianus]